MRIQILILGFKGLKAKSICILISGVPGPSGVSAASPGKVCRNQISAVKCAIYSRYFHSKFKNVIPHRKNFNLRASFTISFTRIKVYKLILNVSVKIKAYIPLYYSRLEIVLLESGKTRRN